MDNDISEETIQLQMQETRASLTEKLETLEQKVVGTVENATAAVTETVDAIKESVQETVATVQEGVKDGVDSVKDFVDVPAHVRRRPWLMVGGSVAVGYCIGTFLLPSLQSRSTPAPASRAPWLPDQSKNGGSQRRAEALPPPAPAAPEPPGMFAAEVAKLKGLALGVLFGTARELLVSSMPTHIGEQLKEVVDSVTIKLGGDPLPSSDWAKMCEETPGQYEMPPDQAPVTSQQPRRDTGNGHAAVRRW